MKCLHLDQGEPSLTNSTIISQTNLSHRFMWWDKIRNPHVCHLKLSREKVEYNCNKQILAFKMLISDYKVYNLPLHDAKNSACLPFETY